MEKKLIASIKKKDPFYRFADMSSYTKEQLIQVEHRVKAKTELKRKLIKSPC